MENKEKRFQIIDLSSYFNNDGISYATNRADDVFNVHGYTYPAEELPEFNSRFICQGVEFLFPDKSDGQNKRYNTFFPGKNIKRTLPL